MFNNVLVPLDGSELAEKALAKAQEIALASDAVVHLIHVVSHRPEYEAGFAGGFGSVSLAEYEVDQAKELVQTQIEKGKEYLNQVAEKLEEAGIKTVTSVLEGAAGEQITEYAEENEIDLIVITGRGHGGVKRLILGSVTDYLVRSGVAPVLVWPSN